jgi:hypothetical protein
MLEGTAAYQDTRVSAGRISGYQLIRYRHCLIFWCADILHAGSLIRWYAFYHWAFAIHPKNVAFVESIDLVICVNTVIK